jgi:hypothetical protein
VTARARRPEFFIVGAPRSGTTALYQYLRQHPGVFMPYRKEPVYFGADLPRRLPVLDERGYLRLFAPAGERVAGEATVWYLYSEQAPAEIKQFNPQARIIIALRNPADMLASLHSLMVFTSWEDIESFEAALDAEADRRQGRRLPRNVWWPKALHYRWLGDYAPHVRRWLETFGREQVQIILFDDLQAEPERVYRQTLEFLGVPATFTPDFAVVNPSRRARSIRLQRLMYNPRTLRTLARLPPRAFHLVWRTFARLNIRYAEREKLDPAVRARLLAELAPAITELEHLLHRDLSVWRR